ncbi:MAG: EamA family transporter [Paracoccaceae bacterium]|jgi:drug/metabolite transporter (DMT)-like permease|nr:EamA family transporter [Paracoccaceae bacterium]MDP5349111.1 EamA family transporter [Paracoccaceae bacterium]MDP5367505.1 EamA family transporter [Paracoccaceae bacterium]
METWVIATVLAAAFQTARFMLQKKLSMGALSTAGATFARFVYSAPLVLLLVAVYLGLQGLSLPALSGLFWAYALTGGLAQILATICVVALFRQRNFAVGITFKKTEVVQTALVGLVVLGEGVSAAGLGAILVGLVGVLLLSGTPGLVGGHWVQRIATRAAGLGLLSGILFAISGVTYRGASLELASDDPFLRAMVTLGAVTASQTIAMTLWLRWREPGQLSAVIAARRSAVWIGLTSMAGSLCWFTAFTLQNAAYVNAVGQIELIFSLAVSVLVFRERMTAREIAGIGLLSASVLSLVLFL